MADVLTYDSAYLAKNRTRIKDDVAYARYKVGSTWYQARIENEPCFLTGALKLHLRSTIP